MPVPTIAGQYRRVEYTSDGCTIYQCLWCLGTIEVRDDPNYGWHFCPKCGKSWFTRKQCRDREVPRWYYDRWGNRAEFSGTILMFGKAGGPLKEIRDSDIPFHGPLAQSRREWYFEHRYRHGKDDEWREWQYKTTRVREGFSDWLYVLSILRDWRLHDRQRWDGDFEYEYRVSIRDKT